MKLAKISELRIIRNRGMFGHDVFLWDLKPSKSATCSILRCLVSGFGGYHRDSKIDTKLKDISELGTITFGWHLSLGRVPIGRVFVIHVGSCFLLFHGG